jgi:di/tricarboxylate transporter
LVLTILAWGHLKRPNTFADFLATTIAWVPVAIIALAPVFIMGLTARRLGRG